MEQLFDGRLHEAKRNPMNPRFDALLLDESDNIYRESSSISEIKATTYVRNINLFFFFLNETHV